MSNAPKAARGSHEDLSINPVFARGLERQRYPRNTLPDEMSLPETAYQFVHDETMLDGNARLNLATFVGTWMDDYAQRLYLETADKNMIDKDEYPHTAAIEERCWRMLADLWHAPDAERAIGTSTIGSSEAAMLGGLALKRRWQQARRAAGKDASQPNLVLSSAVQVCWEKFCNYFEVEPRYVPTTEQYPALAGAQLADYVDENTIGVVAILGVTYTGAYEPVAELAAALDAIQAATGLDVPIHVDGASGAMVAPFLTPELVWDFQLPRVASINTSGHKYGLVYPGVGWVVWRDTAALPEELIFRVSYLGGEMPTFALNFSRPGAQVILQYYQFLRLGRAGFTAVQQAAHDAAKHLAAGIATIPELALYSSGDDLPLVTWTLAGEHSWTLYHLADRLRMNGWLVPCYPLSGELSQVLVQRVVVRNGLSMQLIDDLLDDIRQAVEDLEQADQHAPASTGMFSH